MQNIDRLADSGKNAIDYMQDYNKKAAEALERIADLTRNVNEDNWQTVTDQIFDIAYNNY